MKEKLKQKRLSGVFNRVARGGLAVVLATSAVLVFNMFSAPRPPCAPAAVSALMTKMPATPMPGESWVHNDYKQYLPLCGSLRQGASTVEADIWLRGGQLLVSHSAPEMSPYRSYTLQQLYLDPLAQIVKKQGRVYRDDTKPFILDIELKDPNITIWPALEATLEKYNSENKGLFSVFSATGLTPGAITVVIDGHMPPDSLLLQEKTRLATTLASPENTLAGGDGPYKPVVNSGWENISAWTGKGPFPDADRQKLETLVQAAHAEGRTLRLWSGTIDHGDRAARENFWTALKKAGVDYVSTDDPRALRNWLLSRDGRDATAAGLAKQVPRITPFRPS